MNEINLAVHKQIKGLEVALNESLESLVALKEQISNAEYDKEDELDRGIVCSNCNKLHADVPYDLKYEGCDCECCRILVCVRCKEPLIIYLAPSPNARKQDQYYLFNRKENRDEMKYINRLLKGWYR